MKLENPSRSRERKKSKKFFLKFKKLSPVGSDERLLREELLGLGARAHGGQCRPEALELRLRAVGDCFFRFFFTFFLS